MTTPLWALLLVGIGSPLLTSLVAAVAVVYTRKSARESVAAETRAAHELERRSRREELGRNIRWAAEQAVSSEESAARMGLAELDALGASSLIDEDGQALIDAALASIVKPVAEEYLGRGGDVDVQVTTPTPGGEPAASHAEP